MKIICKQIVSIWQSPRPLQEILHLQYSGKAFMNRWNAALLLFAKHVTGMKEKIAALSIVEGIHRCPLSNPTEVFVILGQSLLDGFGALLVRLLCWNLLAPVHNSVYAAQTLIYRINSIESHPKLSLNLLYWSIFSTPIGWSKSHLAPYTLPQRYPPSSKSRISNFISVRHTIDCVHN